MHQMSIGTEPVASVTNQRRCHNCRTDRKKCHFGESSSSCDRCLERADICTDVDPKSRKLNKLKCAECRSSKQKCLPEGRVWPGQKCDLCLHKGLPCSEPRPSNARPRKRLSPMRALSPTMTSPSRRLTGSTLGGSGSETEIERRSLATDAYQIAIICALPVEFAAMEAMLDETHQSDVTMCGQSTYSFGRIAEHNVVVATPPMYGDDTQVKWVKQLLRDFPSIRIGLLVGIGGGIPSESIDVRLGDVVVSQPSYKHRSGVVQYDFGGSLLDTGLEKREHSTDQSLALLHGSVRKLQARHIRSGSKIQFLMEEMFQEYPRMEARYCFPGVQDDLLFQSSYTHPAGHSCRDCDDNRLVSRVCRTSVEPQIFYGIIASGNMVIKDANMRDRLYAETGAICIEMEAAGLWSEMPTLMIRGICDYADSHKNAKWQGYAAAVAAAYTKELLQATPAQAATEHRKRIPKTDITNAPSLGSATFVGRDRELLFLKRWLESRENASADKRIVLGGMGGVGKTVLALEYIRRYAASYQSVFWFDTTSEKSLVSSFRSIAKLLDPHQLHSSSDQDIILRVRDWLADARNEQWLVVLDNYDFPDLIDITTYIPSTTNGTVIVTSRCPDRISGVQLQVTTLANMNDCLQILENASKRENIKQDFYARRLVERLQGLPLAITCAGAYLKKSTFSIEEYLQQYEEHWNVDPRRPVLLDEYPGRTIFSTWDLAYSYLKENYPEAANILRWLGFLDHQSIWYELLRLGSVINLPESLEGTLADAGCFDKAMGMLVEYSFVEVNTSTRSYSIHPCIQDWTLAGYSKTEASNAYVYAINCVATSIRDDSQKLFKGAQVRVLLPHALKLIEDRFVSRYWSGGLLSHCVNDLLAVAHLLEQADRLTDCVRLHSRMLDTMFEDALSGSPQILTVVESLCDLYSKQSQFLTAAPGKLAIKGGMYLQPVWTTEKDLDVDAVSLQHSGTRLSQEYYERRRFDRIEQVLVQALEKRRLEDGSYNAQTLRNIFNLGILHLYGGNHDEAERYLQEALHKPRTESGSTPQETLRIMFVIGRLRFDQGKHSEAHEILSATRHMAQQMLGDRHALVLDSLALLSELPMTQNKDSGTEDLQREALTGLTKVLGSNYPITTTRADYLGRFCQRQDRAYEDEMEIEDEVTQDVNRFMLSLLSTDGTKVSKRTEISWNPVMFCN